MNRKKPSAWYYNKGKTDIVLSSLGLSIKRGEAVDLFVLKKGLHPVHVRYAERFGSIRHFIETNQLVKLDGPPDTFREERAPPRYTEATVCMPDRSRSMIERDPNEKTFVEQLEDEFMLDVDDLDESELARINERFAESVDLDGFVDDDFVGGSGEED